MGISQSNPTRFAWCIEGSRLRLGFIPTGTIEAICRVDFAPNKVLTGDEELFPDFDTESVAHGLILDMVKAALLKQRIMSLDSTKDASEMQGLAQKLALLIGDDGVTGSLARERKAVRSFLEKREGTGFVMRSPYLGSVVTTSDYGGNR